MSVPDAAVTAAGNAMRDHWLRQQPAIARLIDPMDWAAIALEAAAPHMGRPVFVIAVGHDLTAQDAENIQLAVAETLRHPPAVPS